MSMCQSRLDRLTCSREESDEEKRYLPGLSAPALPAGSAPGLLRCPGSTGHLGAIAPGWCSSGAAGSAADSFSSGRGAASRPDRVVVLHRASERSHTRWQAAALWL